MFGIQEHNPAFDIHVYGASVVEEIQKRNCEPSKNIVLGNSICCTNVTIVSRLTQVKEVCCFKILC